MQGTAALYLGLGVVGIAFGLVSFMLGAFGAPTNLAWIFGNLGIGLLLVIVGLLMGFQGLRERMASGGARRVRTFGTSALLSTLLGIVILALLAFVAARNPVRFDWSEGGVHSLTDQTRKVLAGLEQDVQVTAFFSAIEAPQVRELLDRYAYETERFVVEYADPTARPDLVEKYAISQDKLAQGLLRVALGDEAIEVDTVDESSLTNAIVKLSRTGEKTVYFVRGHNERPVEGEGADAKDGLGRAAEALRNENYGVKTIVLAQEGEIPDDVDVLIVPGPTRPFLEEEHRALDRYVERGGSLMVLVDPRSRTDLYPQLAEWGIEVGEDVVVDRVQGLFGRAATPMAGEYGAHPITEDLRELTMFHVARSVVPRAESAAAFTELVKTGPESWGERDLQAFFGEGRAELGDDDVPGPVSIGVAGTIVTGEEKPDGGPDVAAGGASPAHARIVVFGDSDFASNQLIDAYRNRDLFVNAVNWLLGDVEAISVRPNQSRASRLSQLTAEDFETIRNLSLFVLPELIAVLGVFAWWSRRHAPGRS